MNPTKFYFVRKHIPSNSIFVSAFGPQHYYVFADTAAYPLRQIERVADELIVKWNRRNPDTWQYKRLDDKIQGLTFDRIIFDELVFPPTVGQHTDTH
ncbi:MAG: hypothetical protein ACOYBW_08780 [Fluviibacter phosphoraccumulans]